MGRRDQYIISKANYTLSRRHMNSSIGTIYENDHFTILQDDDIYDDDVHLFSDSNFKFRVRTGRNEKKRHFTGSWVKNNDGDINWTEGNCSGQTTSESKIVLKPNYSSLKDFAYYGSATELIKATVRDVVLRYPGGIYYLGDNAVEVKSGKKTYYTVANDFEIDVHTVGATWDSVEIPMRVLSASREKYVDGSNNEVTAQTVSHLSDCINEVTHSITINGTTLYLYNLGGGNRILVAGAKGTAGQVILKPKEEVFNEEYDKLNDLEKVLLDLDSAPLFKATLDTPYSNNKGYFYSPMDYVWPTGVNSGYFKAPCISGPRFEGYLTKILELASFLDEEDTDNMWRMLTHDSLKNLDWTFMRHTDDTTEDLSDIDSTRLRAMLNLYGRQFDDLKRYAGAIKSANAITYDEKGNTPDYFLTDNVEDLGWDAYNVAPSNTDDKTEALFSGTNRQFTTSDANIDFTRRLALNSQYIQALKGTREGLITILALLGLEEEKDYSINEKVYVSQNLPLFSDAVSINVMSDDFFDGEEEIEKLAGFPIAIVCPNGGDEYGNDNYIIPWFNKGEKYYGDLYFQAKGGWEKTESRKINRPEITSLTEIEGETDCEIYGETLQYMKFASTVQEMLEFTNTRIAANMICYVEDISGVYDGYKTENEAAISPDEFSHYFILENPALSPYVGFVKNDLYNCYGWRNVLLSEFDGSSTLSPAGHRVLYLETIRTTFIGNNPHVSYGEYDDGSEYISYFNKMFKYKLENGMFSMANDDSELMTRAEEFGFQMEEKQDNTKCHAFLDTLEEADENSLSPIDDEDDEDYWSDSFYADLKKNEKEPATETYDEAFSLSVMNVKNIEIEFKTDSQFVKEYIENVVLRYIEQMMPSTAIFSYKFGNVLRSATPMDIVDPRGGLKFAVVDGVKGEDSNLFDFDNINNETPFIDIDKYGKSI